MTLSEKVLKAYKPTQIYQETLTSADLKKLKNEEEIVIKHPHMDGEIKVRREFFIDTVLNQPVAFYGKKYVVMDTMNTIHQEHKLLYTEQDMADYVTDMLTHTSIYAFNYYRSLARENLKIGNVIRFQNGVEGVIALPIDDMYPSNLVYIPLKKDGTLSKHKPRTIYRNDVYEKIADELSN